MNSQVKTTATAALILVLLAAYVSLCTRLYLAKRASRGNSVESLERATRLDPWNAQYHYALARARIFGLMDFTAGFKEYENALVLNPHSARYWLDLAAAYQMKGDAVSQRHALERAVQADPKTPDVVWEVASYYVLQGDLEKALPLYRIALESQPEEVRSVLNIIWQVSNGNADAILEKALPPNPDQYLEFLRLTVEKKNLDASNKAWQKLMALHKPFDIHAAFPYFQFLLEQKQSAAARNAWQQVASTEYQADQDNLIVNGDFERPLLGGGLEWNFMNMGTLELKLDSLEFHGGNHSLLANFDAGAPPHLGMYQPVPVGSGTTYQFSGFMKAVELTTASGPRFLVTDAFTREPLFLSDDISGTTGWKELSGTFKTGPNTTLLKIELVRQPAGALIRGRVFIDDLVLRPR